MAWRAGRGFFSGASFLVLPKAKQLRGHRHKAQHIREVSRGKGGERRINDRLNSAKHSSPWVSSAVIAPAFNISTVVVVDVDY